MPKRTTYQFNIELHKNRIGEFYFKKIADNREQISKSSESYTTKQMAIHSLGVDTLISLNNTNQAVQYPLSLLYLDKTMQPAEGKVLIINEA